MAGEGGDDVGAARMRALVQGLAAGEESALEGLMELHWQPLVAYASRLLGSSDAGVDAAQTAFIRLWEGRARWRAGGSVVAFLYRTTRNLAIDEQRRSRVRRLWATQRKHFAVSTSDPLEELQSDELQEGITRALDALPPRRREVLELARFHDLSYREIAEVMAISPQTVANQMSAALAQLRSELAPFLDSSSIPR